MGLTGEIRRETYKKRRQDIINHFGGSCAVCGETEYYFLAIDHLSGGGKKHLESINTPNIVQWLHARRKEFGEFPSGFQILCHNHNLIKQFDTYPSSHLPTTTYSLDKKERKKVADRKHQRNASRRLRDMIFVKYGQACACCGYDDMRALSIDHPLDDGALERRKLNVKSGIRFYTYLKNAGFPDGYKTLCFNCNLGRAISGGTCPHKFKLSSKITHNGH